MPFICTLDACSRPNVLYDSKNAWINHMSVDHARRGWTCMDSSHDDPLFFLTKEEFSHHITEDHGDDLSAEELDLIADDCYSDLQNDTFFDRCPFGCDEDTTNYSCNELTSHVAMHLLLLSQISLSGHEFIEGIEWSSSADAASKFEALDSQKNDLGNASNNWTMQGDDTKLSFEEDQSDMQDQLPNIIAQHMSETALPIPWSLELEIWTEAGDWDDIRKKNKIMAAYDQGTDQFLRPFIQVYLEKHKDHTADDSDYDSSDGDLESLRRTLIGMLERSAFDKTPHDFLPEGTLDQCITEEVIKHELSLSGLTVQDKELVEFIFRRARKVFAIIVLCKVRNPKKALKWFKSNNVDDTQLPISHPDRKVWSKDFHWDFLRHQWAFFAPVFSTTPYSQDLDEAHILPFISKLNTEDHGPFSVVSGYVMHKSHMQPVRKR